MIELILTEEQKMFRETVRKFGETEVKPMKKRRASGWK